MVKKVIWGFIFFSVMSTRCLREDDGMMGGMPMMMPYGYGWNRPDKLKDMKVSEAIRAGFMQGFIDFATKLTGHFFSDSMLPILKRTGLMQSAVCRFTGNLVYGSEGYDAAELYSWRWAFERDIATHITNVAKGARVIRTHLEQTQPEKQQAQGMPFGISMLKRDLEYLITRLQERAMRYQPQTVAMRTWDKALDVAAGAGIIGVSGYGLARWLAGDAKPAHREVSEQALRETLASQYQRDLFANRQDNGRTFSLNDTSRVKSVTVTFDQAPATSRQSRRSWLSAPWSAASGSTTQGSAAQEPAAPEPHAPADAPVAPVPPVAAAAQAITVPQQVGPTHWQTIKTALPYAIASLAAARLIQWVAAGRAARALDALDGLDHGLLRHLTGDLISYLQHLVQLCDTVHDDNDIAKLKDEFEGLSKHCCELFSHLAYVIDAETATKLQRAGKPGQSGMTQPLGAYGGGSHGLM